MNTSQKKEKYATKSDQEPVSPRPVLTIPDIAVTRGIISVFNIVIFLITLTALLFSSWHGITTDQRFMLNLYHSVN